ncbi:hypothetical protein I316_05117 [Kwoniella heveanensis BCC8398]|uniref:Uncharacterized protein n=1 Tax=Kwoniella heveanensis BCC8398 TaxID=1296120 RepID=A0A1B9GPT6_9TREE|nr:hypothetical protein I316_05117 [Kwoniella heveanensis BCC8398]
MSSSIKSRLGSKSASSSRNSSPAPPATAAAGPSTIPAAPVIDPYRTLSSQVKKPVLPLVPSDPPNLPTLLRLDPSTYSSRLSGKTLQTSDLESGPAQPLISTSGAVSSLVTGKKRNRGHPNERLNARLETEKYEHGRKEIGAQSMRKVKRRLQSGSHPTMGRGMRVSYNALLPLNHLHTTYLIQLLSLPPLLPCASVASSSSLASAASRTRVVSSSSAAASTSYPQPTLHSNPEPILSKLSKADFTGIIIRVKSSKNRSLEGLQGIIIEETALTFRIVVAADDKVRAIPKDGTLFTILVPAYSPPNKATNQPKQDRLSPDVTPSFAQDASSDFEAFLRTCPRMEIDLLGSSFVYRSGDRAGRKFRPPQGGGGGSGWAEGWLKSDWADVFDNLSRALGGEGSGHGTGTEGTKKRTRVSNGAIEGLRKRGKSRRKDPPAGGNLQVY